MPTKEELVKFISEGDFDEEIIAQIFNILNGAKVEKKEEPEDKKEDKVEEIDTHKKVEEIFGKL